MPSQVTEIKIFLASPGDVKPERDIVEKVIDQLDSTIARRKGAAIRLLRWETDTYPYFHLDGPQGAIDEQLTIADCDIFLCIFWQRLGTPTKKANSGTEHEFWTAYEAWKKTGKPIIMLYRSTAPVEDLLKVDFEQIRRLQDLLGNSKIKFENWISEYKNVDDFQEKIRQHLSGIIQDILDGKIVPPAATSNQDDKEMLEQLNFSQEDWRPITYNMLSKYYVELVGNDAIAFFDGREPSWKESVSPSIARREIVHLVKKELTRTDVTSPHIVLLRGLGGEGKSTALQQALYEVVSENRHLYILWHQHTNTPLDLKIIQELADTDYEWIIASDDADTIEKDLRKAVRHIREYDINNIRFLLATRDLDWKAVGGEAYGWPRSADFRPIPIGDLTEQDAIDIVEKWGIYGKQGLGRLSGKNPEVAARELMEKARTEKISRENSLLGAMLQVRTGKTLQEHLKPILARLDEIKTSGNISLRKTMAYISALHAYNIKILTSDILAKALGCSEEYLDEQVLKPLGAEIINGKYILIRHSSIAESIKDILQDDYDFYQLTRKLLGTAHTLFQQKKIFSTDGNAWKDWHKLPKTIYFEKGDTNMGIELAIEAVGTLLVDGTRYDPVAVTDLAYLYEKSNHSNKAVKVFREYYIKTKVDRAYFYKWGVTEGKCKHTFLSIGLAGISLSDGIYEKRRDPERIFVSLSGLSVSFKFAYQKSNEEKFLEACYASAKLGLNSNPDEKAYTNLMENLSYAENSGVNPKIDALAPIINGIRLAWTMKEKDLNDLAKFGTFPENIPSPEKLKFLWLESKLKS
jgi:hypothetical protein